MNPQQSLILNLKQLWHESPRWQNLLLMAMVFTVLAVVFQPPGSGVPANSYTPPGQAAGGPIVPPKAGSGTPVSPPSPGSGQPLNVVAPAIPPPIKIKPGQTGEEVEVKARPRTKSGTDFGQTSNTWVIKPSGPVVEE